MNQCQWTVFISKVLPPTPSQASEESENSYFLLHSSRIEFLSPRIVGEEVKLDSNTTGCVDRYRPMYINKEAFLRYFLLLPLTSLSRLGWLASGPKDLLMFAFAGLAMPACTALSSFLKWVLGLNPGTHILKVNILISPVYSLKF